MAYNHARLCDVVTLSGTTTLVTNASGAISYVRLIEAHNTDSGNVAVAIHRVPNSGATVGTAAAGNRLINLTLTADQTLTKEIPSQGWVLSDTNDTIQAIPSVNGVVNMSVDGGSE